MRPMGDTMRLRTIPHIPSLTSKAYDVGHGKTITFLPGESLHMEIALLQHRLPAEHEGYPKGAMAKVLSIAALWDDPLYELEA